MGAVEEVRLVSLAQAALRIVRTVGHLPGIRDMSNHTMGMAQV